MKKGVTSAVSNTAAAMGLASFTILGALSTKGSLVDIAIFQATKWHAIVLKLLQQRKVYRSIYPQYTKAQHKKQQKHASFSKLNCQ